MKIVKLRSEVERGLELWAGHCQSIMQDKFSERKENGESEYTDGDLKCMQAAVRFMFGHIEPFESKPTKLSVDITRDK